MLFSCGFAVCHISPVLPLFRAGWGWGRILAEGSSFCAGWRGAASPSEAFERARPGWGLDSGGVDLHEKIEDGVARAASAARLAVRAATGPGGFMDAFSDAVARHISPQAFADPPALQEGYQEVDGEMLPAKRWVCPCCNGLLVPDAIDFGDGYPPRSLPAWCPSCGRALGVPPPKGGSVCVFLSPAVEVE